MSTTSHSLVVRLHRDLPQEPSRTGSSQTPEKASPGSDPGETRHGSRQCAISGTGFILVIVVAAAGMAMIRVLNLETVHEVRVVPWMQTGSQNGGHGLTLVTGASGFVGSAVAAALRRS